MSGEERNEEQVSTERDHQTMTWTTIRAVGRRVAASRRRDEHSGSVTPFVLIVTIALFMLAGLVIDGGRHLNSRSRALAYAQEAARAGAQPIDLTSDQAIVNPDQAIEAAERFCAQAMRRDDDLVECDPSTEDTRIESGATVISVVVNTSVETDAILSGMFGIDTWTAEGTASARPVQGVTDPQTGQKITIPPPETPKPTGNPFSTDSGPPPTHPEQSQCPSPYDDPSHPEDPWTQGEPPPTPSPTHDEDLFCWPPWTPPTPDDDGDGDGDNDENDGDNDGDGGNNGNDGDENGGGNGDNKDNGNRRGR